jgi:membrane protein DedA with SNARE-associated domain
MQQYLIDLVARLGEWGYLVIFLGATLESAAFLGLAVPGESLVLVAGFFANMHVFDLDVAILVATVGAILGDNIGYRLGRHLGRAWLLRYGRHIGLRERHIARAEALFARYGGRAVFLGRFVGFARALVPFVAGASRMPYRQFLVYNALGAALWAIAFTLLGYSLGASWGAAEQWIGRGSAIIGAAVLLAGFAAWLWRRRGRGPVAGRRPGAPRP